MNKGTPADPLRDKAYADFYPECDEEKSVYGIWCAAWDAALATKPAELEAVRAFWQHRFERPGYPTESAKPAETAMVSFGLGMQPGTVHPTESAGKSPEAAIDARRKLTDREIVEGVALMKPTADELRAIYSGPDGWSEWENPKPTYLMGCCDCGLIHEMEFRVVRFADDETSSGEVVDDPALGVAFRARRTETQRSTKPAEPAGVQIQQGYVVTGGHFHPTESAKPAEPVVQPPTVKHYDIYPGTGGSHRFVERPSGHPTERGAVQPPAPEPLTDEQIARIGDDCYTRECNLDTYLDRLTFARAVLAAQGASPSIAQRGAALTDGRIVELIAANDPVGVIKGGYMREAIKAIVRAALALSPEDAGKPEDR